MPVVQGNWMGQTVLWMKTMKPTTVYPQISWRFSIWTIFGRNRFFERYFVSFIRNSTFRIRTVCIHRNMHFTLYFGSLIRTVDFDTGVCPLRSTFLNWVLVVVKTPAWLTVFTRRRLTMCDRLCVTRWA